MNSYLVNRMLVEFAATVVVFAKALSDSLDGTEDGITSSLVRRLCDILKGSFRTPIQLSSLTSCSAWNGVTSFSYGLAQLFK